MCLPFLAPLARFSGLVLAAIPVAHRHRPMSVFIHIVLAAYLSQVHRNDYLISVHRCAPTGGMMSEDLREMLHTEAYLTRHALRAPSLVIYTCMYPCGILLRKRPALTVPLEIILITLPRLLTA